MCPSLNSGKPPQHSQKRELQKHREQAGRARGWSTDKVCMRRYVWLRPGGSEEGRGGHRTRGARHSSDRGRLGRGWAEAGSPHRKSQLAAPRPPAGSGRSFSGCPVFRAIWAGGRPQGAGSWEGKSKKQTQRHVLRVIGRRGTWATQRGHHSPPGGQRGGRLDRTEANRPQAHDGNGKAKCNSGRAGGPGRRAGGAPTRSALGTRLGSTQRRRGQLLTPCWPRATTCPQTAQRPSLPPAPQGPASAYRSGAAAPGRRQNTPCTPTGWAPTPLRRCLLGSLQLQTAGDRVTHSSACPWAGAAGAGAGCTTPTPAVGATTAPLTLPRCFQRFRLGGQSQSSACVDSCGPRGCPRVTGEETEHREGESERPMQAHHRSQKRDFLQEARPVRPDVSLTRPRRKHTLQVGRSPSGSGSRGRRQGLKQAPSVAPLRGRTCNTTSWDNTSALRTQRVWGAGHVWLPPLWTQAFSSV